MEHQLLTEGQGHIVATDCLMEFLEVAIHAILYSRQIYPAGIFVKCKKYGIPVHMSVHPELNEYVEKCLASMKPLLERNTVRAVAVEFDDLLRRPVERFIFELSDLGDTLTTCEDLQVVQQVLRALCLKIVTSQTVLKPLPKGCTFVVQVHVDAPQTQDGLNSETFPWIPSEFNESSDTCKIIALRSATTAMFKLQLTVERREFPS